ncbi:hypothetical protein TrST_g13187 [Triparma strigata]|uniref:Uncharacterized protein n=1 Tax=Triparma strigata TaxID=1606541 RepID=A0A9W7EZF4_9STRA|nr:hypothetical protein TrST_g13187 [Triparma strigata]
MNNGSVAKRTIVSETQQKIIPGDEDDERKQDKAEENDQAVVPSVLTPQVLTSLLRSIHILKTQMAQQNAEITLLKAANAHQLTTITDLSSRVAHLELERSSVAPFPKDDFLQTDNWRRLFIENMPVDTLLTMRLLCKDWRRVVDKFIDGKVESGVMIVVGANDLSYEEAHSQREGRSLVTQVVFLLNITKVGISTCSYAVNLVVVEIPEGVESIGDFAFECCKSLKVIKFPKSLTSIGFATFNGCSSLENVDLLHTGLEELGYRAFQYCSELKSMTIPDSLQTINVNDGNSDAVVAHLRSLQS